MPSKFLMKYSILDTVWGCVGERDRVSRKLLYNETQQEANQAMLHNGTHDFIDGVHSGLGTDNSSLGMIGFSGSEMEIPQGPGPRLSLTRPGVFLVLDRGPSPCSRTSGKALDRTRPPQPPPSPRVGPHHQTSGHLASILVFRGSY